MPKMSYEGVVGIVIALIVVILEQAGIVKNPYILWIAFVIALALCLDAALRSGLLKRGKIWASLLIVAFFAAFGVYLVFQLHSKPKIEGTTQVAVSNGTPVPVSPKIVTPAAPVAKPRASIHSPKQAPQVAIDQQGDDSGAVGGSVSTGPCSNVQIGGKNNTASVTCAPPKRHLQTEECDAIAKILSGKNVTLEVGYVISVPDAYDYADDFWECFNDKAKTHVNPDGPAAMGIAGGKFNGGISVMFHGPENNSPNQWHAIILDNSPLSLVIQALLNAKLKFQPHSTPRQEEGRITLLIGEQGP